MESTTPKKSQLKPMKSTTSTKSFETMKINHANKVNLTNEIIHTNGQAIQWTQPHQNQSKPMQSSKPPNPIN